MSGMIWYQEERAAEDALYGQGVAPTRLCRLLLPVWRVQIQAEIYQSQPYDLIDKYVTAAIAQGGLRSVSEVAAFYGLDEAVVGGAARFLSSVGHLERGTEGHLTLTELGLRSVRDNRRYTRSLEDRRQLYLDGFTNCPLKSAYYDEGTMTYLDNAQLSRRLAGTGEAGWTAGPSRAAGREVFTPVIQIPPHVPGAEALSALAGLSPEERAQFNLPEEVVAPSLTGTVQVYLPAYVVRAVDKAGAVRYLAYTQVSDEADAEWSRACSAAVEVTALVENEHLGGDQGEERAARQWLSKALADISGTGQASFERRDGILTALLPASAFHGRWEPRRIGSLVGMNGGWYFRLWCQDERLRQEGLLDLADLFLGSRQQMDPDLATRKLARFGRQMGFGSLTPGAIGVEARKAGRKPLAAQIEKLT